MSLIRIFCPAIAAFSFDLNVLALSANFVSDGTRYRFPTKELSDANRRTTAFNNSTIDHQLFNAPLFSAYITGSASATVPAITNYANTTSDHYPVTTRYFFR